MTRIYLSPPEVGAEERRMLLDAFDSNWIAPVGPDIDAFERELAERVGADHAVALSSGTAALHLALMLVGVGAGDEVLVPSFTFVASAAAVTYLGATPVLVDCSSSNWTIDPDLVAAELAERARTGRLPAAVVTVDLYGQCADYAVLGPLCDEYQIPLVADAAEALGATYRGQPAGSFGTAAVFSFNGNKIITTSGGGMLVAGSAELVDRARYLATQAREPFPHYEHTVIGYNYRLSNLLAALGRAQLRGLDSRIERRRKINQWYRDALGDVPGIEFMPIAEYGEPNWWLTCVLVDPEGFGADREQIRLALESVDIESRPTWKPLHLQPVFAGLPVIGGSACAAVFDHGLCLPSGSALTEGELGRVVESIRSVPA
ncbi:MAG TPA: aminotransferase class I/II-fold pyridoxal phosphate-dependent enzyme [Acidimicrobiales bacterium]|jgi:dTDP-4-amino-4,6-dideoxygalactose transaminase|nr:aminotransferase class I/II-fold pyridoxal phosphate-dependent enzyme [Acidimicrobiales bacterium]